MFLIRSWKFVLLYGLLAFFSYLMLLITLQYVPVNTDVAFLRIKQEEVQQLHYRISFFIHVYTSMLALLAGFTQFSTQIRKRYPVVHKAAGWIYVFVVLVLSGPSGLVMGYYANGGPVAKTAFCLLAVLWMYATWRGLSAVLKKDLGSHKKWIYRSYALTLSAISLRLWKWLIVLALHPAPMDTYRAIAWLGWVGNLAIAEWIIYRTIARKSEAKPFSTMAARDGYKSQSNLK